MPDEKPTLHIDTDWKKQAQEEKRKLVEQEQAQKRSDATLSASATTTAVPGASPDPRAGRRRELPQPSLAAIVESIVTQIYLYLGDFAPRGSEPMLNLDAAKFQIDILGVLEEKTRNNLTDSEKRLLDAALYETRMRYVAVASQYIT